MIFKKLVIFLLVVFTGILGGVYLIDFIGSRAGYPKSLVDFTAAVYSGLFIILALILGKNIPREDDEADEPAPGPKARKDSPIYAYLVPVSGKTVAGFPITRRLMTIGREVRSDILINEESVSKKHAQIMALPGGFMLKDLDSSNGTFINNQRIHEAYLGDGDMVTFGEAKYSFVCAKVVQPLEDGDTSISAELEIDMKKLAESSTATYTSTRSRTAAEAPRKSGKNVGDMTFKPPRGFDSTDDDNQVDR